MGVNSNLGHGYFGEIMWAEVWLEYISEKMEREELSREKNFFKKSFSVRENREMELCYRKGSGIKRHF